MPCSTQKDIREGKISWVDTFFIRLLYPEDGHDVTAVRKNFTMSRYMVVVRVHALPFLFSY